MKEASNLLLGLAMGTGLDSMLSGHHTARFACAMAAILAAGICRIIWAAREMHRGAGQWP